MFKLDVEKAEEPEIKFQHLLDHRKKNKRIPEKHLLMVLEKTLESPLDCKEIQPVHSEGEQPWDFFGRNDAEAETPVLWPPHAKS